MGQDNTKTDADAQAKLAATEAQLIVNRFTQFESTDKDAFMSELLTILTPEQTQKIKEILSR